MSFNKISEKSIENYLTREVRANGGYALKWVCPSWDGVPDRIVIFPKGKIAFAETKAPKKPLRPQQQRWAERLTGLGFTWVKTDSYLDVDMLIKTMLKEG